MNLHSGFLSRILADWAKTHIAEQPTADFIIHDADGRVIRERWHILRTNRENYSAEPKKGFRNWWKYNGPVNIYLHVSRSDDEREPHSHPWWNLSIVLKGFMWETYSSTPMKADSYLTRSLGPGDIVSRSADTAHRFILNNPKKPVMTLFITGPRVKEWFFVCKKGLVHWKEYVGFDNPGSVGRGCGE